MDWSSFTPGDVNDSTMLLRNSIACDLSPVKMLGALPVALRARQSRPSMSAACRKPRERVADLPVEERHNVCIRCSCDRGRDVRSARRSVGAQAVEEDV